MASATEFKAFNSLVNPNDDAIYLTLSRAASGKGNPITLVNAINIMATDTLAEIGIFIQPEYCCIEIESELVVKNIIDNNLDVAVTKIKNKFFIFATEQNIKTTTNNTLVCGISANTYGYSKNAKAIPLPFKPNNNTSANLTNAELLHIPKVLGQLPIWLTPLHKISKPLPDLNLLFPLTSDIDNSLISIYKNMARLYLSTKTKKDLLNYINENFLANPLADDELESLLVNNLMASEISEFFGGKGEFFHNKMGDFIINELDIKKDADTKKLFFWDERKNIYINDDNIIQGIMTRLCPSIKEYQRQEVLKYIQSILSLNETEFNTNPTQIVFKNGILDLETLTLSPMTPNNLETIMIDCNYNPNAKGPKADEFFETATCGDKEIEQILYEAIGYSMLKTSELQKSFMLIGSGRNGKSTYLDIIKAVLGKGNYTAISFKDLAGNFRASALENKLASIAGDISSQPITESDMFKSITAGEDVMIERKYEHAKEKILFCTMFYACNSLPRTPDTSEGFYRRFCIIPFNATLDKISRVDGMLFKKALLSKETIEYVAYKSVHAIYNVLTTTYDFTQSKAVDKMIEKYKIDNNSVLSWFYDSYNGSKAKLNATPFDILYTDYKAWCIDNRCGSFKSSKFTDAIVNIGYDVNLTKKPDKPMLKQINIDPKDLPFDD